MLLCAKCEQQNFRPLISPAIIWFATKTNQIKLAVCILKGFAAENMKMWKAHWDRQLYKALEHQYQMGLEALNENLPEIRVELTYA